LFTRVWTIDDVTNRAGERITERLLQECDAKREHA
jgi:hypothetical protein